MAYLDWGNSGVIDAFGWAHGGWVSRPAEGEEGEVVHSIYDFSKVVDPIAKETFDKWKVIADLPLEGVITIIMFKLKEEVRSGNWLNCCN